MRRACFTAVAVFMVSGLCSGVMYGQDEARPPRPMPPDRGITAIESRDGNFDFHFREIELRKARRMSELDIEERELQIAHMRQTIDNAEKSGCHEDIQGVLFLFCAVVNIMLGVWVYRDIRERKTGSGIWIVLSLLTGFLGTFLYALVRLADGRRE